MYTYITLHVNKIFHLQCFQFEGCAGSCDPGLEEAEGGRASPRGESPPGSRRVQPLLESPARPLVRGGARLTQVGSGSSQEYAPHPLTHPGRWRSDTTAESNYNPQLPYEFEELNRR